MDNIFGLHTFADMLIRKSSYWTRVDGSKWWRNPKTKSIEPYGSPTPATAISPKSEMQKLPEKAKKVIAAHPQSSLGTSLSNFDNLSPEQQGKVFDMLSTPSIAVAAGTGIGDVLGIDGSTDIDEPLSAKLFRALAYTELPMEVSKAKEWLHEVAEDIIEPLFSVTRAIFGDEDTNDLPEIATALYASLDQAVETAGESVSGLRTQDIDHKAIAKAVKEFEQEFFLKLDQYID